VRSDAATHPQTDADARLAVHDLLAILVEDALAVSEDLRAHSADPVLHAAVEALTAARDLLGLAAGDDAEDDAAVPPPPDRRDAILRDALDSIRAASTAIRFALVEEGDRQRARRARPEDPA
jgi:hypothetical protein